MIVFGLFCHLANQEQMQNVFIADDFRGSMYQ
jgi:hypothetical protein